MAGDEAKIGAWISCPDGCSRQIWIECQIEPRGPVLQSNATLVTFSIHLMTSLIGFHNAVLWMVEVARRM